LAAFVPLAMIHDGFVAAHRGPGRRSIRGEILALGGYFGGLFLLGSLAPMWVAPVSGLLLTMIYIVSVIPAPRSAVQFLWRPRNSIQVRSLSRGQWMACQFGLIELTVLTLTLASCGGLIRGGETAVAAAAEMILTSLLGV